MKNLYPKYTTSSIIDITPDFFQKRDIKAVFLDVDNTMKPHYDRYPSNDLLDWMKHMNNNDIECIIVSNGHQERIDIFAEKLGVKAIGDAMKPSVKGFLRAAEFIDISTVNCAVIGDQIFTDILGGNRAGIFTILVNPMSKQEPWWVKIKRVFEIPFRKEKK